MTRHNADKIDAGTVFRVWADGEAVEVMPNEEGADVFGNVNNHELIIDTLPNDNWFIVSQGYTNQDHYNGPVMHNSEFLSIGMMGSILEQYDPTQHYFCIQYVMYDDGEYQGWVVLAKEVTV